MKVKFDHKQQETNAITTFFFKPEAPITYTAGQYAEWTLKHNNPDERGEKHYFTISSPPGHTLVSITTKYAGDDKSSTFKRALFRMEPGADLEMSEPEGDFILPSRLTTPLVFVAGGIGLTPFHSMFEWLAEHHEHRDIRFLYSVRSEEEIIFQDSFDKAAVHATIFVENPSDTWGGERGLLSPEQIIALTSPSPQTLIYISGPEPMVESFDKDLLQAGIQKNQLVTDFFPGYTSI